MEALDLLDEDDNESDDDSIVITYQYLNLNMKKLTRSTKLNKDSVLINIDYLIKYAQTRYKNNNVSIHM